MTSEEAVEGVDPGRAGEAARTTPAAVRSRGGLAVFQVLRRPEFALFWGGQAISLVGTWMQGFAQGWVVAGLTTSAFALGLLNFANSIPTLVLMPFGGVAADRMERRKILIYTQWIMMALAVLTGALIAAGRLEIWHLYGIALLLGAATAYELPAFQSFYPQLVEREDLSQAISLNQATFHGARIIGPALAAWIIDQWGTASAFYANGMSFLAVILALSFIRPRPADPSAQRGSTGDFMREGVRYIRDRPAVQALLGLTGVTTFFIFPNLAVLTPFYAKHVLHVGSSGLGAMMSVSGAGSLVGAVLLLSVPVRQRVNWIGAAAVVILITMSVLAWSQHLWISVAAIALQSFAIANSLGLGSVMVQEAVPDALRGRVMSLYSLMFTGVMPFAALGVTRLADVIGMRLELQLAGVCYAVASLALAAMLCRHSDDAEPAGPAPGAA